MHDHIRCLTPRPVRPPSGPFAAAIDLYTSKGLPPKVFNVDLMGAAGVELWEACKAK
jgi:hypothetical protein